MKKSGLLLATLVLFSSAHLLTLESYFWMFTSYVNCKYLLFLNMDLEVSLEKVTLIFFVMTTTVAFVVCNFSEIYMDGYKVKKFFGTFMMFYAVMILLIFSSSELTLMTGWDMLGLVSVLLVFFYPNQASKANGLLTLFFNRMGDVALMMFLVIMLFNMDSFYFATAWNSWKETSMVMLSVCAFTKSAQFPLSSWLPAAMSAPTPISAMVHSSTLVTAGILILAKSKNYLNDMINLEECIMTLFLFSMIMGGLMACSEFDFKKIIAFSTMSQISLILVFLFSGWLKISMAHMMAHAFFKSSLFSWTGVFFGVKFGSQNLSHLSNKSLNLMKSSMMFSIFAMSGLAYSSSFFTKDKFMESCFMNQMMEMFTLMLMGAILTLIYCSVLSNKIGDLSEEGKLMVNQSMKFKWMTLFSLVILISGSILMTTMTEFSFNCEKICVLLCLGMLTYPLIIQSAFDTTMKNMAELSSSLNYMKDKTYSNLSTISKSGGASFFGHAKHETLTRLPSAVGGYPKSMNQKNMNMSTTNLMSQYMMLTMLAMLMV